MLIICSPTPKVILMDGCPRCRCAEALAAEGMLSELREFSVGGTDLSGIAGVELYGR